MASFRIEWPKSTKKDLRKLPPHEVVRIVAEVDLLAEKPFPHGVEKLSGFENAYRIRVGNYRIIYEVFVDAKLIEIQRIRHRKDVYRK
ncbi:MAG: type II toxin-antitoxin system RelE/ParE family toxin [Verrucomicrobiota bacterium]|nr:type II toxin-antitoxin system RelE/ParE family toxin [Verrucomicrobiota bacterium]